MSSGHPHNHKFILHFERLRQDALACNNQNLAKGYGYIIVSLRKYPLPISTIAQAECLQGVGSSYISEFQGLIGTNEPQAECTQWVTYLRSRIEQFSYQCGGFPMVEADNPEAIRDDLGVPAKRQKGNTAYSPVIGTSAWACIIILHLHNEEGSAGIPLLEIYTQMESFKSKYPKTAKFNDTVINKLCGLEVIERVKTPTAPTASALSLHPSGILAAGDGVKIKLTMKGVEISTAVWQRSLRSENLSSLLQLEQFTTVPVQTSNTAQVPYELVMLVDNREAAVLRILEAIRPGILFEQRTLPIGDVLWVWRREKSDEYLAGYAVERKTIEDLSMSIKDGRYEEQRLRLGKAPGVSQAVYMIEGDYAEVVKRNPLLMPEQSINTAIRHTELTDGFAVLHTCNVEATTEALIDIHVRIQSIGLTGVTGEDDEEDAVTFREFSSETHKSNSQTVAQVTSKMMRSIPGLGPEAVVSINDYLVRTNKGGLSLGAMASILRDQNINETVKAITGVKRIPFNAGALALLREQYVR